MQFRNERIYKKIMSKLCKNQININIEDQK